MSNRVTIALLTICFALAGAGAEKTPPKQKPLKEKPASTEKASKKARGESSNTSIATQQKTAKSLDKKVNPATTRPADEAQTAIDEIDAKIQAEVTRHEAALSQLNAAEEQAVQSGKQKDIAKARKAIEKERSAHDRTSASLNKQRESLAKKVAPQKDAGAGKKASGS